MEVRHRTRTHMGQQMNARVRLRSSITRVVDSNGLAVRFV